MLLLVAARLLIRRMRMSTMAPLERRVKLLRMVVEVEVVEVVAAVGRRSGEAAVMATGSFQPRSEVVG